MFRKGTILNSLSIIFGILLLTNFVFVLKGITYLFIVMVYMSFGYPTPEGFTEKKTFPVSKLKGLQKGDTLWIDFQRGSCFGGSMQKMIISKTDKHYNLFIIENMSQILLDHNATLMEPSLIEPWFRKNASKLLKNKASLQLTAKGYDSLLINVATTIEYFDKCVPAGSEDHSLISYSANSIKGSYDFDCKIIWEIDWASYSSEH